LVADISRNESLIERAETKIKNLDSADESADEEIQKKIDKEQVRISTAYDAVKPAIEDQEAIIDTQKQSRLDAQKPYQSEISNIDRKIALLDDYIENNEIKKAQSMIGANPDGRYGPKTAKAVQEFRQAQLDRRDVVLATLNKLRSNVDTITSNAREEIKRLRSVAEQQIKASNDLIDRLRAQLGKGASIDNTEEITKQRTIIVTANNELDVLFEKKYSIEAQARVLEAEVGPVKYIAELVYGQGADKNTLEEAVRWVIIILVLVFDPLAIVLVIAGITIVEGSRKPTLPTAPAPKPRTKKEPQPAPLPPKVEPVKLVPKEEVVEAAPRQESPEEVTEEVVTDLEDVTDFDSIEGTVRYKGRLYKPTDENYDVVIAQVKANADARMIQEKEKGQMVNKIVAEMRSNGNWPGTGTEEGVVKKRLEEMVEQDATPELKQLIQMADEATLKEVYEEILKDGNNDNR
jgi:peptidoglycan hydrolase-like protein with peptidoglycan-binding domain